MNDQTHKGLLVALDGSDYAFETARYVSKIPSFKKMGVCLFTVFNKIPEVYWDLEAQPNVARRIRDIRAWQTQNEKAIQEYMEKARWHLLDAGFPEEGVSMHIHQRKAGIARDIVKEAKSGYSAVIVGRKGMSKLKDLVLGSVATKLIEKLGFVTLMVVGRNPEAGKFLLALDGSEGSMRTVHYVGKTLGGSGLQITLLHVVREDGGLFEEEARERIEPLFEIAKGHLESCGFESEQIRTELVTGVPSRAGAIVERARQEEHGTIVVGRRGLSKVRRFFMGRVSNKVLQLARGKTVWVVS
jgi:nucleotide-binding universal stress UspA family protein